MTNKVASVETLTPAQVASYVRTYLDLDDVDIPDTLIAVWAEMASQDIHSRRPNWPHLRTEFELQIRDGAFFGFQLEELEMNEISSTTLIDRIEYVLYEKDSSGSDWYLLEEIDAHEARRRYGDNLSEAADPSGASGPSAYPKYWSFEPSDSTVTYGGTLSLWPRPAYVSPGTEYSRIRVGTFIFPSRTAALGTRLHEGAISDPLEGFLRLPLGWSSLVYQFALAEAYAHQDEPEVSELWRARYEGTLARLLGDMDADPNPAPMILNDKTDRRRVGRGRYEMLFDWD